MTDQFCNKCQIVENETTGRDVKAVAAIAAGETVLLERPLIILPTEDDKRCSNCFKYAQQFCSKCCIAPLCLDCQQHSDFDCSFVAQLPLSELHLEAIKKSPASYGILKCLLLYENSATRSYFDDLLTLATHLEKRRKSSRWQETHKRIVQPLMKSQVLQHLQLADRISEDFLQQICDVFDVNAFEIRAPDSAFLRALYAKGAMLNHHCTPNLNMAIDEQYRVKIYANRQIDESECLTISYTNVLMGTAERRQSLMEGKNFLCLCPRCQDPTELGSHMSSLVCAPCAANSRQGYIVKNNELKLWKCLSCSHTLRNEQVDNIVERVKEEVFHAQDDIRRYEILLAKLTTILHPNHYIMFDIKQNIANLLRSIIMGSLQRPGRRLYERKVRLCQELLMVLHIILPGISRLRGIALYELANASAELFRLRFGEKELTREELKGYLQRCEAMLKEAVRMLLYEPIETPEGQLAKSIMSELKDLRNDMQLLEKPLEEDTDSVEV